ncbi:hypothetical protein [Microlunatus sp. Y2014]|uniref:hypothetical protein n=1 Tax=Microlunatus sp. Y2014 TaxID=3418488 RepID=UPI003DA6DC91
MARPRVALIITTYTKASHADVLGTRLINGYSWGGEHIDSRVEVVSVHLEQLGRSNPNTGEINPDMGMDICAAAGIPTYPTPAEALGNGKPGVNVDGVVVIGEHGDYENNEYGQKLYPRRRLIDAVMSAMIAADTFVPIFNDKHLAWSHTDALAIRDNCARLGIPLLAGSTVPIAWRLPKGAHWPMGAEMTEAVGVAYGPFEAYGYHALEGVQAFAERRAGGESGAAEVRGFTDEAALAAVDELDPDLVAKAFAARGLSDEDTAKAREEVKQVITVTHTDGLKSAVIISPVVEGFAVAARGPQHEVAAELRLQGEPYSHFIFLARAAESLIINGTPPYPVERTLFTGGVLDHALRNAAGAVEPESPELTALGYQVPEQVPDTGVDLEPYDLRS